MSATGTIPNSRLRVIAAWAILSASACSAETGAAPSASSAPPSPSVTASHSPAADVEIQGSFDVGGHGLYLDCEGTGSPAVVYLHGAITEPQVDPHQNGMAIQAALQDDFRFCVYDRRNLAHSDRVDAVQKPDDALDDLRNLLAAAEVEPPYVLLGASFGGLLAYLYANTYPGDVVGMVLLDSPFPDELTLEPLFEPEDTYEAFHEEDEATSLERISHFAALQQAAQYIGREPAIPVTYFASLKEPLNVNVYGIPEYDEAILDLQAAYVDRFSPGTLIWADAPHFMEPAIPGEIVEALRAVIAQAN